MRASHYHRDEAPLTKEASMEKTAYIALPWSTEEQAIACLVELEKEANMCFRDDELDRIFEGRWSTGDILSTLEKHAKLSTPEEKERARRYRQQNKAEIARRSKIRRQKIRSGVQRKRRRTGSAEGGYQFVADPSQGAGGSSRGGGGGGGGGGGSGGQNFSPTKQMSSQERQEVLRNVLGR